MNSAFGLKILFCFGFIYIWLLQNFYMLVTLVVNNEIDNINIPLMFSITSHVSKLLILITCPPTIKRIDRKIKMRLGFYPAEYSHLEEAIYIRHKLIASDTNFTACNWFDMDYSLCFSTFGSLVLNLIILIQFANPPKVKFNRNSLEGRLYLNATRI